MYEWGLGVGAGAGSAVGGRRSGAPRSKGVKSSANGGCSTARDPTADKASSKRGVVALIRGARGCGKVEMLGVGGGAASPTAAQAGQAPSGHGTAGLDWKFSQVFGERTPGEEVQEGIARRSPTGLDLRSPQRTHTSHASTDAYGGISRRWAASASAGSQHSEARTSDLRVGRKELLQFSVLQSHGVYVSCGVYLWWTSCANRALANQGSHETTHAGCRSRAMSRDSRIGWCANGTFACCVFREPGGPLQCCRTGSPKISRIWASRGAQFN